MRRITETNDYGTLYLTGRGDGVNYGAYDVKRVQLPESSKERLIVTEEGENGSTQYSIDLDASLAISQVAYKDAAMQALEPMLRAAATDIRYFTGDIVLKNPQDAEDYLLGLSKPGKREYVIARLVTGLGELGAPREGGQVLLRYNPAGENNYDIVVTDLEEMGVNHEIVMSTLNFPYPHSLNHLGAKLQNALQIELGTRRVRYSEDDHEDSKPATNFRIEWEHKWTKFIDPLPAEDLWEFVGRQESAVNEQRILLGRGDESTDGILVYDTIRLSKRPDGQDHIVAKVEANGAPLGTVSLQPFLGGVAYLISLSCPPFKGGVAVMCKSTSGELYTAIQVAVRGAAFRVARKKFGIASPEDIQVAWQVSYTREVMGSRDLYPYKGEKQRPATTIETGVGASDNEIKSAVSKVFNTHRLGMARHTVFSGEPPIGRTEDLAEVFLSPLSSGERDFEVKICPAHSSSHEVVLYHESFSRGLGLQSAEVTLKRLLRRAFGYPSSKYVQFEWDKSYLQDDPYKLQDRYAPSMSPLDAFIAEKAAAGRKDKEPTPPIGTVTEAQTLLVGALKECGVDMQGVTPQADYIHGGDGMVAVAVVPTKTAYVGVTFGRFGDTDYDYGDTPTFFKVSAWGLQPSESFKRGWAVTEPKHPESILNIGYMQRYDYSHSLEDILSSLVNDKICGTADGQPLNPLHCYYDMDLGVLVPTRERAAAQEFIANDLDNLRAEYLRRENERDRENAKLADTSLGDFTKALAQAIRDGTAQGEQVDE